MLNTSAYNGTLCGRLLALPSELKIFSFRLPAELRDRGGILAAIAPDFNRGYPVEARALPSTREGKLRRLT